MLHLMRSSDSPFVADWYAISLRWLLLLGGTATIALFSSLLSLASLVLVLMVFWNIVLSWLAGSSRRLTGHRQISLAVDIFAIGLIFFAQGGTISPVSWMFVLPLLTGAIYFNWRGSLVSALMAVLFIGLDVFVNGTNIIFSGIAIIAVVLTSSFFGYMSQMMLNEIRALRKTQLEAREKKHRIENERLRAIYNLTTALNATLNYKRVLDTALDISANAIQNEEEATAPRTAAGIELVSAVFLFDEGDLTIGASRRLPPSDTRLFLPAKEGLLAHTLEEGAAQSAGKVMDDPELGRLIGLHHCNAVYCIPLLSGYSVYGIMLFAHPQENFFTADRRDILDIISRQAIIAIQNARLYQDLADEKERMAEAQEEARKKLARDLHDGPTQSVAALAMRVNLARRMMERDQKAASEELEKIEDLARRTTKEIRHMLFTLRPLVLESQGLTAALQAMADKMKETYEQNVIIQVDEKVTEQLEMGKTGVIFYIAEEAVNNARKHAQAAHIWVRLGSLPREPEIAIFEISDDGLGFDVESVNQSYDKRGSLGMINLRERTELVNGLLQIDSVPGKGTRIRVYIPMSEDAADKLHHGRAKG